MSTASRVPSQSLAVVSSMINFTSKVSHSPHHRDVRGEMRKSSLYPPHWEKKEWGSGCLMNCSSGKNENTLRLLGILSWWWAKLKQETYGLRNTKDKLSIGEKRNYKFIDCFMRSGRQVIKKSCQKMIPLTRASSHREINTHWDICNRLRATC